MYKITQFTAPQSTELSLNEIEFPHDPKKTLPYQDPLRPVVQHHSYHPENSNPNHTTPHHSMFFV